MRNMINSGGKTRKSDVVFWDRLSGYYDGFMRRFAREYPELLRMIAAELRPDDSVLEVGCGTGIVSLFISPLVRRVTAADISPAMISVAAAKAGKRGLVNMEFSVQDALALTFADSSFDAVIIANALHVVPEPMGVLNEAGRVLNPAGQLLAATYCHGENMKARFLFRLLYLTGFRPFREYTSRSFADLITTAGFSVKKTRLIEKAFPLVYIAAQPGKDAFSR